MVGTAANAQNKKRCRPTHESRTVTSLADTTGEGGLFIIPIPAAKAACKGDKVVYLVVKKTQPAQGLLSKVIEKEPVRNPFLQVHGNILYDLNYRSNIDTPYAEKEVYLHTVQTYLDITVKNNYPFRVFFTTRFGNSSIFRNFLDLNLQFDANGFKNKIRSQVQNLLIPPVGVDSLAKLKRLLDEKIRKYTALKNQLTEPSWAQRQVEAREREVFKKPTSLPGNATGDNDTATTTFNKLKNYKGQYNFNSLSATWKDSLNSIAAAKTRTEHKDSLQERAAAITGQYDSSKKVLDTLKAEIAVLEERYRQAENWQHANTDQVKREINQSGSGNDLKEKLSSLHVSDSSLPKGYQTLLAVKSFGIGRTMVDYSELSAKNISITGLQVEYNPSWYAAFAAGVVDYRYRDYIVQSPQKKQYLGLVRYGKGMKDGNNIIFTFYTGRRQLYNASTTTQGTEIPNYNLMGFTVEGHYKINRTSSLTAEVAKSSSPYYSLDSSKPHNILNSAISMNDHTNEAYSIKLNSFVPATQTQVNASYRHLGANFQSFSSFTSGSAQSAWSVRVDQPLFRRHLSVSGSIRANDFTNPFINTTYRSSTVFKSIQATLRIKKWPTISAGYFPSSQLTKLGDNQFQENLFYTLMASATHVYKLKNISMLTTLMYTQFYNKAPDSGFVYFNTKNIFLSQYAFLGRLTVQLQSSAAINTSYRLYVTGGSANYKFNKWLGLGGGVKYNKQTVYNTVQWGYSATATVQVPKLGEFQLMADKGFIPGNNKQLVENKIGRLTYIKVF